MPSRSVLPRARVTLAACALAFAASALAQTPGLRPAEAFNQVGLAADASREVQNDLMTATLYAEANDPNPSTLASALNRTLNDALKTAQDVKAVKARSGGTQTYPLSDRNGRITGWRGRAEIRLESKDFREMGALVGKLQQSMQLGGIAFAVSPELRRQTENELITEAIGALRARADIVRQAVGGKSLKVRQMNVNTAAGGGPRPVIAMRSADVMSAQSAPAPQFEGGTSQVLVTVQGTVEIE